MKPINIKHLHKVPVLLKLILLPVLPVCIWLFIFGLVHQIVELACIGAIPIFLLIIAGGFFWNYGIRITSKYVTLIDQWMLKVFPYEDVIYIKISFTDEIIFGEVKARNQKIYEFCFTGLDLNRGASFFHTSLLMSGLKLTKPFVEKSIADLSACEKVKIQNLYSKQKV